MKEFDNQLHEVCYRGSGFASGKRRIFMFYRRNNPSKKDFSTYLSKEYGIGGTCSRERWVDYNGKGIRIKVFDSNRECQYDKSFSWLKVADEIAEMIDKQTYMGVRDYATLDAWYGLRKAVFSIGSEKGV